MLGTVRSDGSPQLTVIWYEVRGDCFVFNTKVGREKERNVRRDPRVSLCVEDGYRAVTLDGHIDHEVDDQAITRADILRIGVRYDGELEARRQYDTLWARQRRVTYHVAIDRVYAVGLDA